MKKQEEQFNLEEIKKKALEQFRSGKSLYGKGCCIRSYGRNGEGQLHDFEFVYPPLWGKGSYNQGAGLFRLSLFARFIKTNMPPPARYDSTILRDEDAWNIAAYVNSQKRPYKNFSADWPDTKTKPFDYPFGPFSDTFNIHQHKYGPFVPIIHYKN